MPIEYAANLTSATKYSFVRDASIKIKIASHSTTTFGCVHYGRKLFSPKFPEQNCGNFFTKLNIFDQIIEFPQENCGNFRQSWHLRAGSGDPL